VERVATQQGADDELVTLAQRLFPDDTQ
jgi:hypothetical protein